MAVDTFRAESLPLHGTTGQNFSNSWPPVNPNDPHVIEVAQFAVDEENKRVASDLVFLEVLYGVFQQHPTVTFYRLVINVKGGAETYESFVKETTSGDKTLVYFKPLAGA